MTYEEGYEYNLYGSQVDLMKHGVNTQQSSTKAVRVEA